MARKEAGFTIFQGINIDLANLIAGTYILKIETTHIIDAVKFVQSKQILVFVNSSFIKKEIYLTTPFTFIFNPKTLPIAVMKSRSLFSPPNTTLAVQLSPVGTLKILSPF